MRISRSPPATERPPAVREAGLAVDRLAERRGKLEALFQTGLVSTQKYDTKRTEVQGEVLPLACGTSSLALPTGHGDRCPERTGNSPNTGIPPIGNSARPAVRVR